MNESSTAGVKKRKDHGSVRGPAGGCRNCGTLSGCKPAYCRPGGLCKACYGDLSIRVLYIDPRFGRRGNGNGNVSDVDLSRCEPTDTLPGTPEKVRVLEERVRRGQSLWHPLDAVWAGQGCLGLEVPALAGQGG